MPSLLTAAERQILLLSAGTTARRQAMRDRTARLMADVDWSQLTEILRRRGLLMTLGPRIVELAEGRASEGFVAEVEQATDAGRRHGAFLQLVAMRLMGVLSGAGISSAPLKGPLLAEAIYGDPGRRFSSDIDLLVASDQLPAAVAAVRELGYAEPAGHVDEDGLPLLHLALPHEREELPTVELHWRVHWYEQDFARDRLLPPPGASPPIWRPDPASELAALLLFYARDGFVDLRLATDLSAWWDAFGQTFPAGALASVIEEYPALSRVLETALAVAQRVVGLPAALVAGDLPDLRFRQRLALRLANPNPRPHPSQLYAEMGLIDGLLMPPRDFKGFVRRQLLLPAREVLDSRASRSGKRRLSSSLDYGMCVAVRSGVLARYGLAMTRLMRSPETL
jgi:hypothetical protein